eukprot:XP_001610779.1 hypothetical protein [Babesia bovis T2Bo]
MGSLPEHTYIAELLNDSISTDAKSRESAYQRLLELEANPNFLARVVDVAYLADETISKLAFIYVKHAFTRTRGISVARSTQSAVIDHVDEALDNLKSKLVSIIELHLADNGRPIAKDLALLVRKVSRWNYPQTWMNLHQLLVRGFDAAIANRAPSTGTLNCIFILYHIFKEKCSMRLLRDRNVTMQVAEAWYPYVSKLWVRHWLGPWASGNIDANIINTNFTGIELDISRYLDSLLIAFYTHGLRKVYENSELLELLRIICSKLKTHLRALKEMSDNNTLMEKNTKRLLRGAAELFDKEAMTFAFVDPCLILNPVFDYLIDGRNEVVINGCMDVLINCFRSPVVNNDRYMQQCGSTPGHQGSNREITKINDKDFVIFETFNEMKQHYDEYAMSSTNYSGPNSLKNSSSPTKGSYNSAGGMAEHMSKQATFLFWRCITLRGGISALVEFLRDRYMMLPRDIIEEWNVEPVPVDDPPHPQGYTVISEMKLSGAQMLQYIAEGLIAADPNTEYARIDTFTQLYTIAYQGIASFHTSKHYLSLLQKMKEALSVVSPEWTKLLVYRCSRVINIWVDRIHLFEEQIKSEIMVYLMHCLCCPGNSQLSINLRAQHVIPFYRLYNKTIDEPFWDILRHGSDVARIISSLVALGDVESPIIQHSAMELLCKMCLEFDSEENNFGAQLTELLRIFATRCNNLQVAASLLQTSLGFLNALDWQRCYDEENYVNGHLRRFLFHLLFQTLVISDRKDSKMAVNQQPKMLSTCRYIELEEDTLTLWVSLLRVLPRNIESVDNQLLTNAFILLPLFIDYLLGYESSNTVPQMRLSYASPLHIDIVTEYLTILIDLSKTYLPSASSGMLYEKDNELWFRNIANSGLSYDFSISKVQNICIAVLKKHDDQMYHSGLRLLNILLFGFGRACFVNRDMLLALYDLLLQFCVTLDEAVISPERAPVELRRSSISCLVSSIADDSDTKWQLSKVSRNVVESVSYLIPILSRWGFDSPETYREAFLRVLEIRCFAQPEAILLSLVHAAEQFHNNAYLKLGALVCCCFMTEVMGTKVPDMKLFIRQQDSITHSANLMHSGNMQSDVTKVNSSGVFLPSYMLRMINNIFSVFVKSKKDFCFSITKAAIQKEGDDYTKPYSRRFHLFANVSATHSSTNIPISEFTAQDLFYVYITPISISDQ